jgi:hypothetical protein
VVVRQDPTLVVDDDARAGSLHAEGPAALGTFALAASASALSSAAPDGAVGRDRDNRRLDRFGDVGKSLLKRKKGVSLRSALRKSGRTSGE